MINIRSTAISMGKDTCRLYFNNVETFEELYEIIINYLTIRFGDNDSNLRDVTNLSSMTLKKAYEPYRDIIETLYILKTYEKNEDSQ